MAVLAEFPPEILSIISSSLNAFDIAHLWLSGDRMLLTRLAIAVTHFSLSLAQTVNCCWPKLISQFKRLESLIIRPRSGNHRIWFRDVDFGGISSTLKHLELEFDNLEFSLFGLPFVVPDAYPDPIWSPPTEGEMIFSPFPMSTHFPRLETVRFESNMNFPSILIPMLPPGLLSLSLPYEKLDAFVLRQLPPDLTQLRLFELSNLEIDEFDFQFPSNITDLNISSLNLFQWKPSVMPLPRKLTHLAAKFEILRLDDSTIPVPPTLVHWDLHGWSSISNDLCISLPPGLRHLLAENHNLPFEIGDLPGGLETLAITSIYGLSPDSISHLPYSLTRVNLGPLALPSESLLSLPPFLRSLDISTAFVAMATPYPFMSTLEELIVPKMDGRALHYAPKLKILKIWDFEPQVAVPLRLTKVKSLEQLRISSYASNWRNTEVESFPEGLQTLELPLLAPPAYQRLPRGLTSLHIERGSIDNESIAHLPQGLIKLMLRTETQKDSISDSAIALLPRTLVRMTISDTFALTDIGISNLPRNLRHLNLGTTPLLTNASASLFPRQMISLELKESDLLSNACVKHLPRSLTRLSLKEAPLLSEDCFPDLPPRLSQFTSSVQEIWTARTSKSEEFLDSLPE